MLITLCNRKSQRRIKFILEIVELEKDFLHYLYHLFLLINSNMIRKYEQTCNYSTRMFLWIYHIEDLLSFRSIFLKNKQDSLFVLDECNLEQCSSVTCF